MAAFQDMLVEVTIKKGLGSNQTLVRFIGDLDQSAYGLGVASGDIENFFENDPANLKLLITIIGETNANLHMQGMFNDDASQAIQDFQEALEHYLRQIS